METSTLAGPADARMPVLDGSPPDGGVPELEALLSLWTDDAVLLPAREPPVIGKPAIAEWLQRICAQGRALELAEFQVPPEEMKVIGDWAMAWGYLQHFASGPRVEEPVRERGMTFRILKRQGDGTWRIARWMWSEEALPQV